MFSTLLEKILAALFSLPVIIPPKPQKPSDHLFLLSRKHRARSMTYYFFPFLSPHGREKGLGRSSSKRDNHPLWSPLRSLFCSEPQVSRMGGKRRVSSFLQGLPGGEEKNFSSSEQQGEGALFAKVEEEKAPFPFFLLSVCLPGCNRFWAKGRASTEPKEEIREPLRLQAVSSPHNFYLCTLYSVFHTFYLALYGKTPFIPVLLFIGFVSCPFPPSLHERAELCSSSRLTSGLLPSPLP